MKIYKTTGVQLNRRRIIFSDTKKPVPEGTCAYETAVEAWPSTVFGIQEIVIPDPTRSYVMFSTDDAVVPEFGYLLEPGDRIDSFVKTLDVDLTPPKSKAQRQAQGKRWRESVENGDVIINPTERFKAKVTITAKPMSTKERMYPVSVWANTHYPCADHPTKNHTRNYQNSPHGGMMVCYTQTTLNGKRYPVLASHTMDGGRAQPLGSGYNMSWAEALCHELFQAIKTHHRVEKGLATQVLAEANTRGVDIIANLGELPETIAMVKDALQFLVRLKKQVRTTVLNENVKLSLRRELLRIARRHKDSRQNHRANNLSMMLEMVDAMAAVWMGTRYGLQPIALTMEQIQEELQAALRIYQTDRGGMRENVSLTFMGNDYPCEQIHRIWQKRRYLIQRHLLTQMFYIDGPSAAWELLPLSFVTDWFLNVGDVINACGYPDVELVDRASSSWKNTGSVAYETQTAYVKIDFESYVNRPTRLAEHISLSFDPLLSLKRKIDAAALSWFAFKSKNGLGDRII